jgi:hypothetical protein
LKEVASIPREIKKELLKYALFRNKALRYLIVYPFTFLILFTWVSDLFPSEAKRAEAKMIAEAEAASDLVQEQASKRKIETLTICKEAIRQSVKYPSKMEWNSFTDPGQFTEQATTFDDGTVLYAVRYIKRIEAMNGFGAMLPTLFTCSALATENAEEVTLMGLQQG